jgi:hypothetical protein
LTPTLLGGNLQTAMQLLNHRMVDGSRQFAALPESMPWNQLGDHLARLRGVQVTKFLTDGVIEAWIDFTFRGHKFTINNQLGEYWFFVAEKNCSDEILGKVAHHCKELLSA